MSGATRTDSPPRDKAATRRRLLDAAVATFAARGYDGASLREIAAAAVANVSLISRYFGGKEGLFLAVSRRLVDAKTNEHLPHPVAPTLEAEIAAYLEHRLTRDAADWPLIRVVMARLLIDDAYRAQAMAGLDGAADRSFRARLAHHRAEGRIAPDVADEAVFTLIGHVSFGMGIASQGLGLHPPEALRPLCREIARTVARGLEPRPG
ncbi:MAG: TetR/AcrR family transcriptional regulator [Shimia sp.]